MNVSTCLQEIILLTKSHCDFRQRSHHKMSLMARVIVHEKNCVLLSCLLYFAVHTITIFLNCTLLWVMTGLQNHSKTCNCHITAEYYNDNDCCDKVIFFSLLSFRTVTTTLIMLSMIFIIFATFIQ